jgi:hypothetical protein
MIRGDDVYMSHDMIPLKMKFLFSKLKLFIGLFWLLLLLFF